MTQYFVDVKNFNTRQLRDGETLPAGEWHEVSDIQTYLMFVECIQNSLSNQLTMTKESVTMLTQIKVSIGNAKKIIATYSLNAEQGINGIVSDLDELITMSENNHKAPVLVGLETFKSWKHILKLLIDLQKELKHIL